MLIRRVARSISVAVTGADCGFTESLAGWIWDDERCINREDGSRFTVVDNEPPNSFKGVNGVSHCHQPRPGSVATDHGGTRVVSVAAPSQVDPDECWHRGLFVQLPNYRVYWPAYYIDAACQLSRNYSVGS